jgi:hypothetical protein
LRIYVGDSELVKLLLEYFEQQADCVAVQVGETEIDVALLGSYRSEAHDAAVERLVTEFQARERAERHRLGIRVRNGNGTTR